VPKRPAPAAGSPAAKRVRFSKQMTMEDVIKDILEKVIDNGKLLSSYSNPETNDMCTHVADLIKKDLVDRDYTDAKNWRALVQRLHQTLTGGAYQDLPNFEKNKTFLENEMGEGYNSSINYYRDFVTLITHLEPGITPERLLDVARTLSGTKVDWKPDDYTPGDYIPEDVDGSEMCELGPKDGPIWWALWYAITFKNVYTPLFAEALWQHDPKIMKHVLETFPADWVESEDEESDEEATERQRQKRQKKRKREIFSGMAQKKVWEEMLQILRVMSSIAPLTLRCIYQKCFSKIMNMQDFKDAVVTVAFSKPDPAGGGLWTLMGEKAPFSAHVLKKLGQIYENLLSNSGMSRDDTLCVEPMFGIKYTLRVCKKKYSDSGADSAAPTKSWCSLCCQDEWWPCC
jgi:hypothetical protein